jgi:hypothetical protein
MIPRALFFFVLFDSGLNAIQSPAGNDMFFDAEAANPPYQGAIHRTAVEDQLERLLLNRHFSQSRRFPAFLRFVVQKTLDGEMHFLKERTLGVEIFGRKAEYDTSSDPIVRVTAAEIRKRIAQYYQEPDHENELRISLEAGSYIPQFHWPKDLHSGALIEHSIPFHPVLPQENTQSLPGAGGHKRRWLSLSLLPLLIGVGIGLAFAWRSSINSPISFFWGPVLNANNPALLCIVDQSQYSNLAVDAADPERQITVKTAMNSVNMDDLSTIVKVASLLQSHGKRYTMKGAAGTTLSDLSNGPAIFVGAFDNAWTMRLTKPLRFHFGNSPAFDKEWIADSQSTKQWSTDRPILETANDYREYAIVARFTDSNTGQLAVIAAGIGQGSTLMAGDFLTNRTNLAELERDASSSGKKNIEAVLSTQIIDGQPGTPRIEATYVW